MKTYTIQKSKRKDKKFSVTVDGKTINFGQVGYSDYTIHHDYKRMLRYDNRHRKHENWNNLHTAGFWAKWILWNKPSLTDSIHNTEKRFGINIKLKKS